MAGTPCSQPCRSHSSSSLSSGAPIIVPRRSETRRQVRTEHYRIRIKRRMGSHNLDTLSRARDENDDLNSHGAMTRDGQTLSHTQETNYVFGFCGHFRQVAPQPCTCIMTSPSNCHEGHPVCSISLINAFGFGLCPKKS